MRKRIFSFSWLLAIFSVVVLGGAVLVSQFSGTSAAPTGGQDAYRVAAITQDGHIYHAVMVKKTTNTMPNTTPQSGSVICAPGDASKFAAELVLTGTMAGTNPAVTVVLQHSIDYDAGNPSAATWRNVGTSFAQINSTVTPTGGREDVAFSDVAASTAIVWGDCYRTLTTWSGTGTVTANYGVYFIAK